MVKQLAIIVAGVIIGLVIFQVGSKMLGLDSYEENYELGSN